MLMSKARDRKRKQTRRADRQAKAVVSMLDDAARCTTELLLGEKDMIMYRGKQMYAVTVETFFEAITPDHFFGRKLRSHKDFTELLNCLRSRRSSVQKFIDFLWREIRTKATRNINSYPGDIIKVNKIPHLTDLGIRDIQLLRSDDAYYPCDHSVDFMINLGNECMIGSTLTPSGICLMGKRGEIVVSKDLIDPLIEPTLYDIHMLFFALITSYYHTIVVPQDNSLCIPVKARRSCSQREVSDTIEKAIPWNEKQWESDFYAQRNGKYALITRPRRGHWKELPPDHKPSSLRLRIAKAESAPEQPSPRHTWYSEKPDHGFWIRTDTPARNSGYLIVSGSNAITQLSNLLNI